jgi:hypothetical protein
MESDSANIFKRIGIPAKRSQIKFLTMSCPPKILFSFLYMSQKKALKFPLVKIRWNS